MFWHGAGFGVLPMFLIALFWIAVVVVAVVLIVRLLGGPSQPPRRYPRSEAEDILKQRYARGELTKEQFDEMLDRIRR